MQTVFNKGDKASKKEHSKLEKEEDAGKEDDSDITGTENSDGEEGMQRGQGKEEEEEEEEEEEAAVVWEDAEGGGTKEQQSPVANHKRSPLTCSRERGVGTMFSTE